MSLFSYYGGKSKLVHRYPPPRYSQIIEPFAGAANYALRYWERDVTLVDKYEVIIHIWRWLQQCSREDILGLPKLKQGMRLSALNLSKDEKLFLGFVAVAGNATPCDKVSQYADFEKRANPNFYRNIADTLPKIKHWKVMHGSYEHLSDQQATWFVDAPYQHGGHKYKHSNASIDYSHLAQWCKERSGQVIVCENTKADWLPFVPIAAIQGANKSSVEALWLDAPLAKQETLFFV